MENDDAMVGRLFSRREALITAARSGLVLVAGAGMPRLVRAMQSGPHPVHIVVSPQLTEGPFFVDENLNRSDLVSGTTRPTVANGLPLLLSLSVYKLKSGAHEPLQNAHVDLWHADAAGAYSDEANPMNREDTSRQTWLRGYQTADSRGGVAFRTIFPGWYGGRAPHIHFKVRTYSSARNVTAEFTSQLFFRDADAQRIYAAEPYASRGRHDTSNADDGVYNDFQIDGKPAGSLMLLDLAKNGVAPGYKAHFAILVDDSNLQPARQRRHGPGGPPPGDFGPPPGGG